MFPKSRFVHDFVDRDRLHVELARCVQPVQGALSPLTLLSNWQRQRRLSFAMPTLVFFLCASLTVLLMWATYRATSPGSEALVGLLGLMMAWTAFANLLRVSRIAGAKELSYLLQLVQKSESARAYVETLMNHLERPRAFEVDVAEKLAAYDLKNLALLRQLIGDRTHDEIREWVEVSR